MKNLIKTLSVNSTLFQKGASWIAHHAWWTLWKRHTFSASFHPVLFTRVDPIARSAPYRTWDPWCSFLHLCSRRAVPTDKSLLTSGARADLPTCFLLRRPQLCIFSTQHVRMSLAHFFFHLQILHGEYNVSYESTGNALVLCIPGTNLQ